MKLIIYLFILIIFSFQNAYGIENCKFKSGNHINELSRLSSIKQIEVKVNDYRKWMINSLKIFNSKISNIADSRKKKFSGMITISYPFGKCILQAEIRQHGDWKDHVQYLENGNFIQSLDIKLKTGNIAGITKFKLLLPITRNKNNEIFATVLLRQLDFLAPKTILVKTSINETNTQMLFQEKTVKELLETQNRREGAILEGNEKLLWAKNSSDLDRFKYGGGTNLLSFTDNMTGGSFKSSQEFISLSRLINGKWAIKNNNTLDLSINAITVLQKTYMDYAVDRFFNNTDLNLNRMSSLNLNYLSNQNTYLLNKWVEYEIFVRCAGGEHALRPHNRKFYWNPFYSGFEPLYYDGNFNLLNKGFDCLGMFTRDADLLLYKKFLKKHSFDNLLEKLNKINIKILKYNLENFKLVLNEKKIQDVIFNLVANIKKFKQIIETNDFIDKKNNEKNLNELIFNYKKLLKSFSPNTYYIKTKKNSSSYKEIENEICLNNNCKKINFNKIEDWKAVLENKYIYKKKFTTYFGQENFNKNIKENTLIKEIDLNIQHSPEMKIMFSSDIMTLFIEQNKSTDWALIFDENIKDINIKFIGKKNNLKNGKINYQKSNSLGLSGCLTFYNVNFYGTNIEANNGLCEDVINIVRGNGYLNKIILNDAYADGVDIDSSILKINLLDINNTQNDCLDLSLGNYDINRITANNCKDKAISVGEKSILNNYYSVISNSKVGVASKDSSITKIENLLTNNIQLCFEAYNKKQEFNGAQLFVNKSNCIDNSFFADYNSLIKINGVLQ